MSSIFGGIGDAIGNAVSGAKLGDWVQLANLGAGIWAANEAGDASNNATNAAAGVAQGQLDLSREALDWYKSTYAEQGPAREAAERRAQAVSDAQLRGMNFAIDQASELDAYNKQTFRPLEKRFVEEASTYDTPERRQAAAAAAAADVDNSAALARQAQTRALGRAGINPGDTKALALAEDSNVGQAVARGAAMTGASRNVEQQGYARMADAVGLGRGLAPTQATQQQIATTTGNSSVGNAIQGLGAAQSGNAFMGQGFNTAMTGNQIAGNLFNQVASGQRQDENNLLTGVAGIGNFLGRTFPSDKNMKTDTSKTADGKKALAEIDATPVKDGWKYRDDPAQEPKTGPMAQDVRANMGEAVAPGGKAIDVVSMNGKMLAAIQALSKDVKALKREKETA